MAGPTTAERGERQKLESGPPRPPFLGRLRRPHRLIILLTAVVLAGAAAVWILYGSPWLRVERVSTSGTRVLTAGQVEEAADVPVGSPLMSIDTEAIEARLRGKLPRIDSVDVVRSWPHGIGLKVTERTPVLIVEKGAKFVEVDAKGVRFATVSDAPKGVPVLELTVSRPAVLRRFPADRLVREAVRIAGDIPDSVARDTRTVKVRSYDAVSLELRGGRTVEWGSGEKGRAKARTLLALMKADPEARHFDVSAPTAPASSGS
ncbi:MULTISPECIES: cell division protein FtsQ/DivIB [unclassified Streptomyces]|uniref:cell division protein FtsQ/DivIB n=1 Tax=unclassified Streptomyces TaxID=2593676 RepID=UPI00225B141B|nr:MULTISPECIES: FtsQ-type POTRA domain-containing protein [unclassified Streptomyces]MCX4991534.1 FtsQ-type POTRA domain-containing protein [Streptomyces sp. NBC_00568]MCX5003230.1 FtsQ-type POTRA domain-containing protein [Streptomyces sp. NBC_00638]